MTYRVTCPTCKKHFRLSLEELHPGAKHRCAHCGTSVVLTNGTMPKAVRVRKERILADISKVLNK